MKIMVYSVSIRVPDSTSDAQVTADLKTCISFGSAEIKLQAVTSVPAEVTPE